MAGTFQRIGSQTAVYGLSSIVGRFLNYLLVPLYTRVFVPEEYGVVTELYAWASFLGIVLTYGMETAYFRFSSDADSEEPVYRTASTCLILSSLVFLIFSLSLFPFADRIPGYTDKPHLILLLAGILTFDAVSAIPFARLRPKMPYSQWAYTVHVTNSL
jgi:O-antigen/teichoic acid export membrane protein